MVARERKRVVFVKQMPNVCSECYAMGKERHYHADKEWTDSITMMPCFGSFC